MFFPLAQFDREWYLMYWWPLRHSTNLFDHLIIIIINLNKKKLLCFLFFLLLLLFVFFLMFSSFSVWIFVDCCQQTVKVDVSEIMSAIDSIVTWTSWINSDQIVHLWDANSFSFFQKIVFSPHKPTYSQLIQLNYNISTKRDHEL